MQLTKSDATQVHVHVQSNFQQMKVTNLPFLAYTLAAGSSDTFHED
jgi:hypothetical protein